MTRFRSEATRRVGRASRSAHADHRRRESSGREKLEQAYDVLEQEAPDRVARAIRWLRNPKGRWVRLPLGLVLVVTGFFGFLPILGYEFIPLGLLLIAQDVPPLQKPVGTATLWLERKWIELRDRWRRRHRR